MQIVNYLKKNDYLTNTNLEDLVFVMIKFKKELTKLTELIHH